MLHQNTSTNNTFSLTDQLTARGFSTPETPLIDGKAQRIHYQGKPIAWIRRCGSLTEYGNPDAAYTHQEAGRASR